MTNLRASKPDFIRVALLLAAISSLQAERPVADATSNTGHSSSLALMEGPAGLSRPGAGPYRSGISLRQFIKDPAPCGPKQIHLFVNRPCTPRTGGDNTNTNTEHTGDSQTGTPGDSQTGTNDSSSSHTGNNSGGPVIVLGGSPYHLNDNPPSGDHPNPDGGPPHGDTKLPDHFEPTPEPTYMVVTGMAFAAVWLLGRKRRTA
jgi:hypothetical protein